MGSESSRQTKVTIPSTGTGKTTASDNAAGEREVVFLTNASDFYLAEFEALRKEIQSEVEYLRKIEVYAVIATGAVWGFLVANRNLLVQRQWALLVVALLPLVVSIFGYLRCIGIRRSLARIGGYIAEYVEPKFIPADTGGWERFLRGSKRTAKGKLLIVADNVIWLGLLVLNVAFCLFALLLFVGE